MTPEGSVVNTADSNDLATAARRQFSKSRVLSLKIALEHLHTYTTRKSLTKTKINNK